MNKNLRLICLSSLAVFCLTAGFVVQQQNTAPVVKIVYPKNNANVDLDATLQYQITVADKEDGDSKYDEINGKEVLLEVRYVANKTKLKAIMAQATQPDAPGLLAIRTSNCINCHNFNGKAMGPSFEEISRKYPATKVNIDTLVSRIKDGSTSIWGKDKMPSHPELTTDEIKNQVRWILKYGAAADVSRYSGLQGQLRLKRPSGANSQATYLLIASYIDHGVKTTPGKQRLKGQDMVVIGGK